MPKNDIFIHSSAYVDDKSVIGDGSKIWHFSHVLGNSVIGKNVTIGQNVMIGPKVNIGHHCKIQNNVSLYEGVTLEDYVFCGPSCVFTNVKNPRAGVNRKNEFSKTLVKKGATIGANATILCGVQLGEYCMVGAGSVVTKDVPAHRLVLGNPARAVGWVSHAGEILSKNLVCPREKRKYKIIKNSLKEVLS